jgi:hypothetical protein
MDMADPGVNKKKTKSKKPLWAIIGSILVFGVFVAILIKPSKQSKAIKQIQICATVNEVKLVYEKYKLELIETDESGKSIVSLEFQNAVRQKIESLNLRESELKECLVWIPPSRINLNVIVIPDLSRRITDTLNNPSQIEHDKTVFKAVWNTFVEYSKLKQDSKDRIIVDVTDIDQARGQFGNIANQLQFDLSTHSGKSNRLYFTQEKETQFTKAIDELYFSAASQPLGADYILYLRRYLSKHLKFPTLYDDYINKVIIITDGYLELEKRFDYGRGSCWNYTEINPQLLNASSNQEINDVITSLDLNIPKADIDLSNTEILVCEVNERKYSKGKDLEILRVYWKDWFNRMNAKEIKVLPRDQATDRTTSDVKEFILN